VPPCLVKLEVSRDFVDDDGVLEILGRDFGCQVIGIDGAGFFCFFSWLVGVLAGFQKLPSLGNALRRSHSRACTGMARHHRSAAQAKAEPGENSEDGKAELGADFDKPEADEDGK